MASTSSSARCDVASSGLLIISCCVRFKQPDCSELQVVEGWEVVKAIEACGSNSGTIVLAMCLQVYEAVCRRLITCAA